VTNIVVYELNEVPWRVVDRYVSSKPNSNLANLLDSSSTFTSRTIDTGELHPWSTWPTVHRGVHNEKHNIRSLNQDISSASDFPPVWDILTKHDKTVGIFGSLQSFPPSSSENMLFHIPDTFAPRSDVKPEKYQKFQEFNLVQAGANKAVAGKVKLGNLSYIADLVRAGVTVNSLCCISKHIFSERFNHLHRVRRPILQPIVGFDVFKKCLTEHQPEYCTFFSNHVAGIMHRYWKYTFPEDFDYQLGDSKEDKFHTESILKSMDVFDIQLGWLRSFCTENNYDLIVCSSMGQEAIIRDEYIPELAVDNFDTVKKQLNWQGDVKLLPAMQPNVSFEFENESELNSFSDEILKISDTDGKNLFTLAYEPVKNTLNLALRTSKVLSENKKAFYRDREFKISDIGLKLIERDVGTGYHQPEGVLIWSSVSDEYNSDRSRREIDTRQILPEILHNFGIPPSDYHLERFRYS